MALSVVCGYEDKEGVLGKIMDEDGDYMELLTCN